MAYDEGRMPQMGGVGYGFLKGMASPGGQGRMAELAKILAMSNQEGQTPEVKNALRLFQIMQRPRGRDESQEAELMKSEYQL